MRKILFSLVFVICYSYCFGTPPGYHKSIISTTTYKNRQVIAGDFEIWNNINSSTTSFEVKGGSITKCSGITATGTLSFPSASLDGADIKNNEITDTQLEYNTGQDLTSISSPTFSHVTASSITITGSAVILTSTVSYAINAGNFGGFGLSNFLYTSSATATYLQKSSATATYLQKSSATATYLQKSSATATYLQKTSATATYQPLDADLTDLADGSLTGSKVGSGIVSANIAAGALNSVTSLTASSITLTTDLAVTEGGTGASTLAQYGVVFGNAANAVTVSTTGAAGDVLCANGTGNAAWKKLTNVLSGNYANTNLSNLDTTSINKDLLPSTNVKSIGATGNRWDRIYARDGIFTYGVYGSTAVFTSVQSTCTYSNNTNLFDGFDSSYFQPLDSDLTDLADGSLTGSKVGSGVPAANIAAGSLGSTVIASSVALQAVGGAQMVNNTVTDTQLAYNTGQHLTVTSTPTFACVRVSSFSVIGQYTLPIIDGSNNQYLKTNGDGGISWGTITGTVSNGTTNYNTLYWNGASWTESDKFKITGTVISSSGHFDGTTSTMTGKVVLKNDVEIQKSLGSSAVPAEKTLYLGTFANVLCNFSGVGTPGCNYGVNVSSITDLAVGKWRVNFAKPFPNTRYCVAVSANNSAENMSKYNKQVKSVDIYCYDVVAQGYRDVPDIDVIIWGYLQN